MRCGTSFDIYYTNLFMFMFTVALDVHMQCVTVTAELEEAPPKNLEKVSNATNCDHIIIRTYCYVTAFCIASSK